MPASHHTLGPHLHNYPLYLWPLSCSLKKCPSLPHAKITSSWPLLLFYPSISLLVWHIRFLKRETHSYCLQICSSQSYFLILCVQIFIPQVSYLTLEGHQMIQSSGFLLVLNLDFKKNGTRHHGPSPPQTSFHLCLQKHHLWGSPTRCLYILLWLLLFLLHPHVVNPKHLLLAISSFSLHTFFLGTVLVA